MPSSSAGEKAKNTSRACSAFMACLKPPFDRIIREGGCLSPTDSLSQTLIDKIGMDRQGYNSYVHKYRDSSTLSLFGIEEFAMPAFQQLKKLLDFQKDELRSSLPEGSYAWVYDPPAIDPEVYAKFSEEEKADYERKKKQVPSFKDIPAGDVAFLMKKAQNYWGNAGRARVAAEAMRKERAEKKAQGKFSVDCGQDACRAACSCMKRRC